MPRRSLSSSSITGLVIVVAVALGVTSPSSGKQMQEIQFDMGRNIVDTAKASGVPSFTTRSVDGLISYSVNGIPATIPARYARLGYELSVQHLFAFTMYADEHRSPGREVEAVSLQVDQRFESHVQAQAFVEQLIGQFRKGKWQRYYNPTWDALLTGRSSFLDKDGGIASPAMTIDPNWRIAPDDWRTLVNTGASWRWVGDGVLAVLSVTGNERVGKSTPDYVIDLAFDLLDVKLKHSAADESDERKKGDSKGWNSTADYEKSKRDRLAVLKVLEAIAIKRGDAVVTPH